MGEREPHRRDDLRVLAALGEQFESVAERDRVGGRRTSSRRRRRWTAGLALGGLLLVSAAAGAATGLLPIGSVVPAGRHALPKESAHTVVAHGELDVGGPWQMTYYRSGRLADPRTGTVYQPAGLSSLDIELLDPPEGMGMSGAGGNCGSRRSPGFNAGTFATWDSVRRRGSVVLWGCAPERASGVELRTAEGRRLVEATQDGPSSLRNDFWTIEVTPPDVDPDGHLKGRIRWVDAETGTTGPWRYLDSPRRGWLGYYRDPVKSPTPSERP